MLRRVILTSATEFEFYGFGLSPADILPGVDAFDQKGRLTVEPVDRKAAACVRAATGICTL